MKLLTQFINLFTVLVSPAMHSSNLKPRSDYSLGNFSANHQVFHTFNPHFLNNSCLVHKFGRIDPSPLKCWLPFSSKKIESFSPIRFSLTSAYFSNLFDKNLSSTTFTFCGLYALALTFHIRKSIRNCSTRASFSYYSTPYCSNRKRWYSIDLS